MLHIQFAKHLIKCPKIKALLKNVKIINNNLTCFYNANLLSVIYVVLHSIYCVFKNQAQLVKKIVPTNAIEW